MGESGLWIPVAVVGAAILLSAALFLFADRLRRQLQFRRWKRSRRRRGRR